MTRRELDDAIRAKVCPTCDTDFRTQAATLRHIAVEHPILSREQRGPVVLEKRIVAPYRNERSSRVTSHVLHDGTEIEGTGWHAEAFVLGVEWAAENL